MNSNIFRFINSQSRIVEGYHEEAYPRNHFESDCYHLRMEYSRANVVSMQQNRSEAETEAAAGVIDRHEVDKRKRDSYGFTIYG